MPTSEGRTQRHLAAAQRQRSLPSPPASACPGAPPWVSMNRLRAPAAPPLNPLSVPAPQEARGRTPGPIRSRNTKNPCSARALGDQRHHQNSTARRYRRGTWPMMLPRPADNGGGKPLDRHYPAHVEADGQVQEAVHDPGDAAQRRAEEEGVADDDVHVDAHHPRCIEVFRRRPHGAADPGLGDQQVNPVDEDDGGQDQPDLRIVEDHRAEFEAVVLEGRIKGVGVGSLGEELLDRFSDDDAHGERRHQHDQHRHAAHGTVGEAFHQRADDGADRHGKDEHQKDDQEPAFDAQVLGQPGHDKAREPAQHEDLAMGEVDQAQDSEEQREAYGHQGVHPPDGEAVDQLLNPGLEHGRSLCFRESARPRAGPGCRHLGRNAGGGGHSSPRPRPDR